MIPKAIQNYLGSAMERRYPDFPFLLEFSPDDDQIICMRVFAVPAKSVSEVKDFIRKIRDNEVIGDNILVLPMIKTEEVTKEHYPEMLPKNIP